MVTTPFKTICKNLLSKLKESAQTEGIGIQLPGGSAASLKTLFKMHPLTMYTIFLKYHSVIAQYFLLIPN